MVFNDDSKFLDEKGTPWKNENTANLEIINNDIMSINANALSIGTLEEKDDSRSKVDGASSSLEKDDVAKLIMDVKQWG